VIVDKQNEKIAGLEEKNLRMQQKNTDLENDLQGRQQENNELAARVEDLQDMLASKVAPSGNPGASLMGDADVQGRWNALCFDIRQLVAGHVNPSGKRGISISALRALTRADEAILRDRDGCYLLAQATIWSILVEHVFGNGARMSRMFWAGRFSEGLRCLCRSLPGSQMKFLARY
jgi:hypothetical protein